MTSIDKHWEIFIFVIIAIGLAFIVSRILRYTISKFIKDASQKLNVDPTRYNFLKNAVDFGLSLFVLIIIFRSIPALRSVSTTLLTGAGVLAAILGLASQAAFSNIISGFFLVIFKPFRVGDRVNVGLNYSGDVEDINLRHTIIRDARNRRVIIPNSIISNETIINSTITDERVCIYIDIPISLQANIQQAMEVIQQECIQHKFHIDNRTDLEKETEESSVSVRAITFLDSGILLRAYIWAKDSNDAFVLKCDLNKSIKIRFDELGIPMATLHHLIVNNSF